MAKSKLRQGTTVWESANGGKQTRAPLRKDISTEVLIVGAGVTGALMAEAMTAIGKDVVVLDKRGPASGSTAASTALLLFEIDKPLIVLGEKIGRKRAQRAWLRSYESMQRLTAKIKALAIDCDYIERDAILLPGTLLGPAGLRRECEARQELGLPSRIILREQLIADYGIDRPNAILSKDSAETDPVRFCRGLLNAAKKRGARMYFPEEIKEVVAGKQKVVARTASGRKIEARFLVLCCGYELPNFLNVKSHQVVSTWAAATVKQPKALWPSRALIWECAESYAYIRTSSDGRVIVGGEDEEHNDPERRKQRIPAKVKRLKFKLSTLLPAVDRAFDFAWSGAFGTSATGLPTIGNIPGMPRCCAVLGFGGNGMTYAQVASEMVANALSGKDEPDIDLFAFNAR